MITGRTKLKWLSGSALLFVVGSPVLPGTGPAGWLAGTAPAAAASPCNPCAAVNPCNPCAAANPCNPCAAGAAVSATGCSVPRLSETAAASPCAAANPCNPCAAAADAELPELTEAELIAAYDCVLPHLDQAYRSSGREVATTYQGWTRFSRTAYPAEAHGLRFMNNYANEVAADQYGQWEGLGAMPAGSVLAKDSFLVGDDGAIAAGPLFIMEKRAAGYSASARDWHYAMIMPGGAVREDASIQEFCNRCHRRAGADDDYLMFLPERYRQGGT